MIIWVLVKLWFRPFVILEPSFQIPMRLAIAVVPVRIEVFIEYVRDRCTASIFEPYQG